MNRTPAFYCRGYGSFNSALLLGLHCRNQQKIRIHSLYAKNSPTFCLNHMQIIMKKIYQIYDSTYFILLRYAHFHGMGTSQVQIHWPIFTFLHSMSLPGLETFHHQFSPNFYKLYNSELIVIYFIQLQHYQGYKCLQTVLPRVKRFRFEMFLTFILANFRELLQFFLENTLNLRLLFLIFRKKKILIR